MIGREKEISELTRILESSESEFVMVYGRRRVGKTYLIREFFNNDFVFHCTGIANGTRQEQLINFRNDLYRYDDTMPLETPGNWMEAFDMLYRLVERSEKEKKVIFLDEVPWMYTQKSDFLRALEHFWNSRASQRTDIILIVCGSAASWMVKKIVNSKGGLHNRVTLKLKLQSFTLRETKSYLNNAGIFWDDRSIAECYMILGGIPYYLKLLDRSLSLTQNVDRLFFNSSALLEDEFKNLYSSLFRNSSDYIRIVEILSQKKSGYSRDEIITKGKFNDGGGLTEKLDDLVQCDFVRKYKAIGDVQHTYQLCDFYSLFYFQFIKKGKTYDSDAWMHLSGKPTSSTWKGLAFERLCIAHLQQIKESLGISGISTNSFSYFTPEMQIDLVIERGDRMINICEMKYYDGEYVIDSSYAEKIKLKISRLKGMLKRRYSYSVIFITADGVRKNEQYFATVQKDLTIDALFR